MHICLEMVISYFFLFAVFVVGLGEGQNGCDEFPCGSLGPAIRFPFRLNSQPHHCGYPGFNLSCTHRNETVLQLPIFVKFFVKNIDYKSQVIEVYDPDQCFLRQLHTLNLTSSPFQILKQHHRYDYALFNCSSTETQSSYAISCLSSPGHKVRAFSSDNDDVSDLPIASCKKMYNLRSISSHLVYGSDNINLLLKWSGPKCRHSKGIINFYSSFSLVSSQYWFGYLQ